MTDVLDRKDIGVVLAVCAAPQPALASDLSTGAVPLTSIPVGASSETTRTHPANSRQKAVVPGTHRGLENAVRDILARGGYRSVEIGHCQDESPSLEDAIKGLITHGAQHILVVPTVISLLEIPPCECFVEGSPNSLQARIVKIQAHYPEANEDHICRFSL